jgi:soluble lytic murein transglycosylase-like protein
MASPYDNQYDSIRGRITYYANLYGVNPTVGIWQLWHENRFRNSGCSNKNACGIAQFIPATAARFGVDRNDIESSLNGWGKYMSWLLRQPYIKGNIALALAGYNAGEGSVKKYGGIPPFRETQNYVAKILRDAGTQISPNQIPDLPGVNGGDSALYLGIAAIVLFLILD